MYSGQYAPEYRQAGTADDQQQYEYQYQNHGGANSSEYAGGGGVDGSFATQQSVDVPPGSRPFLDVNASGQVDPSRYPEPKDSTHKVRGKGELLQMICDVANQELLLAKLFYFFFYSAFGSLFPLMAVYFKQMGMNSGQCGILIGVRPFVEFLSTPFWTGVADRYQRGKTLLMAAICSWIFFTMMLSYCQPVATACIVSNSSHYFIDEKVVSKRSVDYLREADKDSFDSQSTGELIWLQDNLGAETSPGSRPRRSAIRGIVGKHVIGQSPRPVTFVTNYDEEKYGQYRAPPFSSTVFNIKDIQKVFFLTFMLVALGEFFSSPAITLADSVILSYLGEEADHYGQQRMFGSIGWGLAMFFVGIALDNSTSFPNHPCEPHTGERNYSICFATFSVLMGCALITSSQFKFDYAKKQQQESQEPTAEEQYDASVPPVRDWQKPQPQPARSQTETIREAMKNLPQLKSRVFANTITKLPEWTATLKDLKNLRCMAFLVVAWWMGMGMGLIFGFLFWHLQDFGGTPTMFGIASVINHFSEICAYFFCFRLINQYGHVKILCLGLLANVLRFLYISWLTNPWLVLPFELVQGITHATTWAACVSFLNHAVPDKRSSTNGVLQIVQHLLGKGLGAIFGGALINSIGSQMTFRLYGFLSLVVLLFFIFVNFYRKDVGFQTNLDPSEDPRHMADEGGALAPHGVPASPMPRALSSSRLGEQENGGHQSSSNTTADGRLGVAGSTNPFAADGSAGYGSGVVRGGGVHAEIIGSSCSSTAANMKPAAAAAAAAVSHHFATAVVNPSIASQLQNPRGYIVSQTTRAGQERPTATVMNQCYDQQYSRGENMSAMLPMTQMAEHFGAKALTNTTAACLQLVAA